jgi:hypothetical protein
MPSDDVRRVALSGDLKGRYVVTEQRPDGSLVLEPDHSPLPESSARAERPGEGGLADRLGLGQLLGRRREASREDALVEWGVHLSGDEVVVEFVLAVVDSAQGFVALTSRRLIFLAGHRSAFKAVRSHPLSELGSVESASRGRKGRLVVTWEGEPPMVIESPDRSALERLEACLLIR